MAYLVAAIPVSPEQLFKPVTISPTVGWWCSDRVSFLAIIGRHNWFIYPYASISVSTYPIIASC